MQQHIHSTLTLNSHPSNTMAETGHGAPAVSTCTHVIPSTLAPKLLSLHLCPTCMISSQIETIESVQQQFDIRGGLFQSKEAVQDGHSSHAHKSVRRKWRNAKVALINTVERFEDLLNDNKASVQDLAKLREALNVWDKKKILLSRVPGLKYIDGAEEGEPTDEEKKGARLLMVWLRMVIEKETEELRGEGISSLIAKRLYNPHRVPTTLQSSRSDLSVGASTPAPALAPIRWVSTPEPASKERSDAYQSERTLPPVAKTTATPLAKTRQDVAMPKPILKRSRTSTTSGSQSASRWPKRVRTSNSVTISPEHLYVTNPSPFQPLSRTAIVLPHAAHALAENHRHRHEFHRTSPVYVPGAWASEAFDQKANTSFRGMSRQEMKKHFEQDEAEQEQEQVLPDKLRDISRGWVALWWANKVVPHLDLERLKLEMLARIRATEVK
jgi:hypothetical protein